MSTLAARYVRKPSEALAVEVKEDNIERVANWCDGNLFYDGRSIPDIWYITNQDQDGELFASVGDFVVLEDDEFFAISKEEFQEKYQELEATHLNGVWLTNPFSG